ncbi:hypothetical protein MMC07_002829 [Pseudocyphellaria aurata]|nr:hypothetical protein [Pseudocyphellaria aurata]
MTIHSEKNFPFFQKSTDFTPPNYAKRRAGGLVGYDASAFSPVGGPLQVSYSNFWQPLSNYFRKAFVSLGLKPLLGFNSGQILGFSEFTSTLDPRAETRSSSETSFLQAALESSDLQVYQQTLAKRILFDANKIAIGVSVTTSGVSYVLSARKEVILADGVFRSPQMLMVSSIGPAATLEKFEIPVLSDLQGVGQNMWDQPYFGVTYRVNVTTQSQLYGNATFAAQATEEYLQNQTGPLTSLGGNAIAFEKLPRPLRNQLSPAALSAFSKFPADWPELELLPLAATTATTKDSENYASFTVAVLATTSRGNVTINSTDTNDNPLVSPNWLLTSVDQELAIQSFKRARKVAAATGATVGPEFFPGSSTQSDVQIHKYIRETLAPIHHASTTRKLTYEPIPAALSKL